LVTDEHGIKKIYASSTVNPQYFSFPVKESSDIPNLLSSRIIARGGFASVVDGSGNIGWWEFTPEDGNDVKLTIVPDSLALVNNQVDIDINCDLNHAETHAQQFISDTGEWKDVEITSHVFVKAVDNPDGYFYFEVRSGHNNSKESGCCQDTAYGVRLYWNNSDTNKGKFAFYKRHYTGSMKVLEKQIQPQNNVRIETFYQQLFGVKFVVYNPVRTDSETNPTVRLELYVSPVLFMNPGHAISNVWTKVGEIEDRIGKKWTDGGLECGATADDFPITWAAPFVTMGWQDGKVIQFNYTSFREINPTGSIGEDPDPGTDPDPAPDPEVPLPDPLPPDLPTPEPPDAEPPIVPTAVIKRLTLRREILNSVTCRCDGKIPSVGTPPSGGGGGGGGGTGGGGGGGTGGSLTVLYNVNYSSSSSSMSIRRLASVDDSSSYYLRFGQGVTQPDSKWINKIIVKVELPISEKEEPRGSSFDGVRCVIRDPNDVIVATLSPTLKEEDISNKDKFFVFQNLTNTYKMVFGSKLLWEYDGGDRDAYVEMFARSGQDNDGTKIVWQANDQDSGEYRDNSSYDLVAKVYTITGQVNTALTEIDDDPVQ
jgi:hypothetical protein